MYYSASTLISNCSQMFCKKSSRFLKKRSRRYFPVIFAKTSKAAFLDEFSGRLHLYIPISYGSNRSCRRGATWSTLCISNSECRRNLFEIEKDREKMFLYREKPWIWRYKYTMQSNLFKMVRYIWLEPSFPFTNIPSNLGTKYCIFSPTFLNTFFDFRS